MHRILIALLAALDAIIAAAVGLFVVLAALTLLWIFALGTGAEWAALWPATARIWQLGNLVPVSLELDEGALAATGLPEEAAAFGVSLAPLAFALFVVLFAARSGRRAVRSGGWVTGLAAGAVATTLVAALVQLTSDNPVAAVVPWQAVLFPVLIYAAGSLAGAWTEAWSEGDGGIVDALRERIDAFPSKWREVPTLAVRGAALALTGIVGAAAVLLLFAVLLRAGEVIALFERLGADAVGTSVIAVAQLAYVPTLVAWAAAWLTGPGFAVGAASAVSPAGTQLGVVPGIPVLGLLPEQGSGWLLLVLLLPVAAGVAAGWAVRSSLVAEWRIDPPEQPEFANEEPREPVSPRLALAVAIAVLSGAGAALIAVLSSGAFGPGRMAVVGPDAGQLALAVGLETLLGAAIMLLSPRARTTEDDERAPDERALAASAD